LPHGAAYILDPALAKS